MNCQDAQHRLHDYVDGELGDEARAELERHLAGCSTCREELEALRGLTMEARSLPRRIEPEADLWAGIARRIGGEGAFRPPAESRLRPRTGRPVVWRLAAALLLMAAGAGLATIWLRPGPADAMVAERARYTAATAELAERLSGNPAGLDPATLAVVRQNLEILDAAIEEAEAALADHPGDHELERMLRARYEQRLALLTRANRLAQSES